MATPPNPSVRMVDEKPDLATNILCPVSKLIRKAVTEVISGALYPIQYNPT